MRRACWRRGTSDAAARRRRGGGRRGRARRAGARARSRRLDLAAARRRTPNKRRSGADGSRGGGARRARASAARDAQRRRKLARRCPAKKPARGGGRRAGARARGRRGRRRRRSDARRARPAPASSPRGVGQAGRRERRSQLAAPGAAARARSFSSLRARRRNRKRVANGPRRRPRRPASREAADARRARALVARSGDVGRSTMSCARRTTRARSQLATPRRRTSCRQVKNAWPADAAAADARERGGAVRRLRALEARRGAGSRLKTRSNARVRRRRDDRLAENQRADGVGSVAALPVGSPAASRRRATPHRVPRRPPGCVPPARARTSGARGRRWGRGTAAAATPRARACAALKARRTISAVVAVARALAASRSGDRSAGMGGKAAVASPGAQPRDARAGLAGRAPPRPVARARRCSRGRALEVGGRRRRERTEGARFGRAAVSDTRGARFRRRPALRCASVPAENGGELASSAWEARRGATNGRRTGAGGRRRRFRVAAAAYSASFGSTKALREKVSEASGAWRLGVGLSTACVRALAVAEAMAARPREKAFFRRRRPVRRRTARRATRRRLLASPPASSGAMDGEGGTAKEENADGTAQPAVTASLVGVAEAVSARRAGGRAQARAADARPGRRPSATPPPPPPTRSERRLPRRATPAGDAVKNDKNDENEKRGASCTGRTAPRRSAACAAAAAARARWRWPRRRARSPRRWRRRRRRWRWLRRARGRVDLWAAHARGVVAAHADIGVREARGRPTSFSRAELAEATDVVVERLSDHPRTIIRRGESTRTICGESRSNEPRAAASLRARAAVW